MALNVGDVNVPRRAIDGHASRAEKLPISLAGLAERLEIEIGSEPGDALVVAVDDHRESADVEGETTRPIELEKVIATLTEADGAAATDAGHVVDTGGATGSAVVGIGVEVDTLAVAES